MNFGVNKIFAHFLVFSFINYTACYSSVSVSKEKFFSGVRDKPVNDLTIVTKDNKYILINEATFEVKDDTVHLEGVLYSSIDSYGKITKLKIALSDIQYVEIEELNDSKTAGCIISLTGVFIIFIALIASASSSHSQPKSCGGSYQGLNLQPN